MPVSFTKTHFLEQKVLSAIFNNISYSVTTVYVGLYTSAPDKTGGGTEVSTGSYARQALSPILSAGILVYSPQDATGSTISFVTVNFPTVTGGGYGTVVAVGLFDAVSGGNLLAYQTITGVIPPVGQVPSLGAGNLLVLEA